MSGRSSRPGRYRRGVASVGVELALDLLDELEVELEQAAQEADDEQEVLAPVGQRLRARLGLGEAEGQVAMSSRSVAMP